MADLHEIETLIGAHINAVQDHERLFMLADWGLASDADMKAALDPIDVALVALCAAKPADAVAEARRAKYLKATVSEAIYCNRGLTETVIDALVGGANG